MSTPTSVEPAAPAGVAAAPESLWTRLTLGHTQYEIVRRWKRWFALSGIVILIGMLSLLTRGLSLGIDFKGGSLWELPKGKLTVATARETAAKYLGANPTVQVVGGDKIRVQGEKADAEIRTKVADALAAKAGIAAKEVNTSFVGPSWGKDVSRKAQKALVVFFFVIAAFISVRFEWKMAVAALLAVVHDVFITVGVYSLTGFEATPATVIAFLTILGYSLYDTIVVFDRVNENTKALGPGGKTEYSDIVNLSMNQVLMRSLNTSFVAILPIVSILVLGVGVLGAKALGDFGLALFIGLLTGAYSSIFIAAPALAILKEREAVWTQVRQRLAARKAARGVAAAAATLAGGTASPEATAGALYDGGAPRGRKVGRKH